MRMSKPKVSVVVPCYNVAQYLARCLDSLINQTLQDIEIICIDDKSTDNTLEILRDWATRDSRIKVIALDKNSGVSVARNAGLDVARGKYIGFVDSDDYIDTDFYEKLYTSAIANSADISRGGVKCVWFDGKELVFDSYKNIESNGKWAFDNEWWSAIYNHKMISDNNIRFKQDVISGQDGVFLTEAVSYTNKIIIIPDTFYHYIRRADSLDSSYLSQQKVISKIKARNYVVDIYNSSDMTQTEYLMCYKKLLNGCLGNLNRTTAEQSEYDIVDNIIELVHKCKMRTELLEDTESLLSGNAVPYILSYDTDGLLVYLNSFGSIRVKSVSLNLFNVINLIKIKRNTDMFELYLCGLQIFKLRRDKDHNKIKILGIIRIQIKR